MGSKYIYDSINVKELLFLINKKIEWYFFVVVQSVTVFIINFGDASSGYKYDGDIGRLYYLNKKY